MVVLVLRVILIVQHANLRVQMDIVLHVNQDIIIIMNIVITMNIVIVILKIGWFNTNSKNEQFISPCTLVLFPKAKT